MSDKKNKPKKRKPLPLLSRLKLFGREDVDLGKKTSELVSEVKTEGDVQEEVHPLIAGIRKQVEDEQTVAAQLTAGKLAKKAGISDDVDKIKKHNFAELKIAEILIGELQTDLDNFKDRKTELEDRIAQLEKSKGAYDKFEGNIDRIVKVAQRESHDLDSLMIEIAETEKEFGYLSHVCERIASLTRLYQDNFKEFTSEKSSYDARIKDLKSIGDSSEKMRTLFDQKRNLLRTIVVHVSKLQTDMLQAEHEQVEFEQLSRKLVEQRLKKQIVKLEEDLTATTQSIKTLESEHKLLLEEKSKLAADLDTKESALKKATADANKKDLDAAEKQKALSDKLNAQTNLVESLSRIRAKLERENSLLESEFQSLTDSVSVAEVSANLISTELSSLRESKKQLEEELAYLIRNLESTQEENKVLKKKVESSLVPEKEQVLVQINQGVKKAQEEFSAREAQLKEELKRVSDREKAAIKDIESARSKVKTLTSSLKVVKSEKRCAKSELTRTKKSLEKRIKEQDAELNKLRKSVESLSKKSEELNNKKSAADEKFNELDISFKRLQAEKVQIERNLANSLTEQKSKDEKIKDWEKYYSELEHKYEEEKSQHKAAMDEIHNGLRALIQDISTQTDLFASLSMVDSQLTARISEEMESINELTKFVASIEVDEVNIHQRFDFISGDSGIELIEGENERLNERLDILSTVKEDYHEQLAAADVRLASLIDESKSTNNALKKLRLLIAKLDSERKSRFDAVLAHASSLSSSVDDLQQELDIASGKYVEETQNREAAERELKTLRAHTTDLSAELIRAKDSNDWKKIADYNRAEVKILKKALAHTSESLDKLKSVETKNLDLSIALSLLKIEQFEAVAALELNIDSLTMEVQSQEEIEEKLKTDLNKSKIILEKNHKTLDYVRAELGTANAQLNATKGHNEELMDRIDLLERELEELLSVMGSEEDTTESLEQLENLANNRIVNLRNQLIECRQKNKSLKDKLANTQTIHKATVSDLDRRTRTRRILEAEFLMEDYEIQSKDALSREDLNSAMIFARRFLNLATKSKYSDRKERAESLIELIENLISSATPVDVGFLEPIVSSSTHSDSLISTKISNKISVLQNKTELHSSLIYLTHSETKVGTDPMANIVLKFVDNRYDDKFDAARNQSFFQENFVITKVDDDYFLENKTCEGTYVDEKRVKDKIKLKNEDIIWFDSRMLLGFKFGIETSKNLPKWENYAVEFYSEFKHKPIEQDIIAIGDIHGDFFRFANVLKNAGVVDKKLNWKAGNKKVILLGDYVDRGGQSFMVLDLLMHLKHQAKDNLVMLCGNHDFMFLGSVQGSSDVSDISQYWWANDLRAPKDDKGNVIGDPQIGQLLFGEFWKKHGAVKTVYTEIKGEYIMNENMLGRKLAPLSSVYSSIPMSTYASFLKSFLKIKQEEGNILFIHAGIPFDVNNFKFFDKQKFDKSCESILRAIRNDDYSADLCLDVTSPIFAAEPQRRNWEWYSRKVPGNGGDGKTYFEKLNPVESLGYTAIVHGHREPDNAEETELYFAQANTNRYNLDFGMSNYYNRSYGGWLLITKDGKFNINKASKPSDSANKSSVAALDKIVGKKKSWFGSLSRKMK